MSRKQPNSPEQKASNKNNETEFGSEYAVKSKPAPGHKAHKNKNK